MKKYIVTDNFEENYGEYSTLDDAKECVIDLIQMELEDGFRRCKYSIIETTTNKTIGTW